MTEYSTDSDELSLSINAIEPLDNNPLPSHDLLENDGPYCDHSADRALIDTGAFASVTNQKHLLHNYIEFSSRRPCPIRLQPATKGSDAIPEGFGYLHVPCSNSRGYLAIKTFYHPSLRTTVIDDRDILKSAGKRKKDYVSESIHKHHEPGTFTIQCWHRRRRSRDIFVHGILIDGKCYTRELIAPDLSIDDPHACEATSSAYTFENDPDFREEVEKATLFNIYAWQEIEYSKLREELTSLPVSTHSFPFHKYIQRNTPVCAIRAATQRLLWHQRLGHPSDYYLYHAHKHIKGVPKFPHMADVLDQCPTCIQAKQTKEPAGPNSTRSATEPYQGLSIDFSFSGTKSQDPHRTADYVGLNGETCWLLVTDHFTRYQHGITRKSKATPISWLRQFLIDHSPRCLDKYAVMDQGGELHRNPAVIALFTKFGYTIRPTGADSSNQNAPVERAHLTVANAVRSFLIGAALPVKFWPYAFHHYLRIKNSTPSRDQTIAPLKLATGRTDDFSDFRTFGCRVWVRPPGRRKAKLLSRSRKGIFLGFLPDTTRNILWYDVETHRVKIAKHARFDEGMNDLPHEAIPPNVLHLQRTQDGLPFPAEATETSIKDFYFSGNPFSNVESKTVSVTCDHPTYGFLLATDDINNRVFVQQIKDHTSAACIHSSYRATCNKLRGSYIVSINNVPVFSESDALSQFQTIRSADLSSFIIELAPERRLNSTSLRRALVEHDIFQPDAPDDSEAHVPAMTIDSIRCIASLRYKDLDFSPDSVPNELLSLALNAITSSAITPEEQALGKFTRRKLKKLSTWNEWRQGEHEQLDHFHDLQMFGTPVQRPPNAIVLRPHWTYGIKRDGRRRARYCCDGSKKSAPALHRLVSTYSSCVMQPVQRLFFALSAAQNYRIYGADARDAYAHSPPPDIPTFVAIDDQYADWYLTRFGTPIDRTLVLPVKHAFQGHPEAGKLWEKHVSGILLSMSFTTTTHDKSIYSATIDGVHVLLLRQVDDFALACPDESLAKRIFDDIGTRLQFASETTAPIKYFGLISEFNGVDVAQFSNSIVLSSRSYIERVMKTHGWSTPASILTKKTLSPLPDDAISSMYSHVGPPEDTPEHHALSDKHGFRFRSLLGELLYAYVTCRPDIGYALVTLSKFASSPHEVHFALLKHVAKYLRETMDWGITYHKPILDPSLPVNPMDFLSSDASLPAFPTFADPTSLLCLVDAAHANEMKTRRSTTGYAFLLSGGVVAYRCTTQSITATSSTEAEFLAAVTAAKQARYLRSILAEIGFRQLHPTPIYEDNMSAIKMINSRVPTERSRHIDIQHFAIQDWKEAQDIVMQHIPGIINAADDLIKPLGWILHTRHARRILGHYSPVFTSFDCNASHSNQGRVSAEYVQPALRDRTIELA